MKDKMLKQINIHEPENWVRSGVAEAAKMRARQRRNDYKICSFVTVCLLTRNGEPDLPWSEKKSQPGEGNHEQAKDN